MARSPKPSNRGAQAPILQADALEATLAAVQAKLGLNLTPQERIIGEDETFWQWACRLERDGAEIDGKPFNLSHRRAMAWFYKNFPSTPEECHDRMLVLMKCAQVGFTTLLLLGSLYFGLKFGPATIGIFLPSKDLAEILSEERFMPLVRSLPKVHALMTQDGSDGSGPKPGEGKLTRRRLGDALYVISWTSGRATTESVPMDFLLLDEVQEMTLSQIEKVSERLSASRFRYRLLGSTANWPGLDIHHFYKRGTQHRFHTECPTCGAAKPLDDYFPECIKRDEDRVDMGLAAYRYVCENGHWIDDSQQGEWIPDNPGATITSAHFHQMLSPDMTPGQIMEKFTNSTDKKNFHNRVLGKPFMDPDQIPVTMDHMMNCVAHGKAAGLEWKTSSQESYMGIDQMGHHNVVVIKERMPDGRQATIHLEEIYHEDPFARCDELMAAYNVAVCVVEINPNYNDAKRFAGRHPGRVFICNSFGAIQDDMLVWGDAPKLDASERRTDEAERDRWTVRIDQFKCMSTSLARFTGKTPLCLFPDDQGLMQNVVEKGIAQRAAIAPRAFFHFTRTALVVEPVKEGGEKEATTNRFRRVVKKVGVDPHFSYANLLCDVAWARSTDRAIIIVPAPPATHPSVSKAHPVSPLGQIRGAPNLVQSLMLDIDEQAACRDTCVRCVSYRRGSNPVAPLAGTCEQTGHNVAETTPACGDCEPIES